MNKRKSINLLTKFLNIFTGNMKESIDGIKDFDWVILINVRDRKENNLLEYLRKYILKVNITFFCYY